MFWPFLQFKTDYENIFGRIFEQGFGVSQVLFLN